VKFKNCGGNFGKSDNAVVAIEPLSHRGRVDGETGDVSAQILAMDVGERGCLRISPRLSDAFPHSAA
jgi:hypothetical protein